MSLPQSAEPMQAAQNLNTSDDSSNQRRSERERIVEALNQRKVEFFCTPELRPFAEFIEPDRMSRIVLPVRSKEFRARVTVWVLDGCGKVPSASGMEDGLRYCEGLAHKASRRAVHFRTAGDSRAVYHWMGDDAGRVIEVTSQGWRLIEGAQCPIRFVQSRGSLPMVEPSRVGGALNSLFDLVPITDAKHRCLLAGWMLGALSPDGPFPILWLEALHGSGKSMAARMIRALIDPHTAPIRTAPRDVRDVIISAKNSRVLAFDNLSHIGEEFADIFCVVSTGVGYSARELYSDDDETIINVCRPQMITTIDEPCARPDFLDRVVRVKLDSIAEDRRKSEAHLWQRFNESAPGIIAGLLDAQSCALRSRRETETTVAHLPRLADFALNVIAAEPELRHQCPWWGPGLFSETLTSAAHEAVVDSLDGSQVAQAIRTHLCTLGSWSGTAGSLLSVLDPYRTDRRTGWPSTARGLANAIRRLAPALRHVGIETKFRRERGERRIEFLNFASSERM